MSGVKAAETRRVYFRRRYFCTRTVSAGTGRHAGTLGVYVGACSAMCPHPSPQPPTLEAQCGRIESSRSGSPGLYRHRCLNIYCPTEGTVPRKARVRLLTLACTLCNVTDSEHDETLKVIKIIYKSVKRSQSRLIFVDLSLLIRPLASHIATCVRFDALMLNI